MSYVLFCSGIRVLVLWSYGVLWWFDELCPWFVVLSMVMCLVCWFRVLVGYIVSYGIALCCILEVCLVSVSCV